ncbi:MAG: hypothetical protein WA153_07445 [Candidatus Acidiferrales bacterium]
MTIITFFGVLAALRTLRTIRDKVGEMRKSGGQTDKLIAESIAQSKSMERSVAEAARLTVAMEKAAQEIAISAKAAVDSVSVLGPNSTRIPFRSFRKRRVDGSSPPRGSTAFFPTIRRSHRYPHALCVVFQIIIPQWRASLPPHKGHKWPLLNTC